MLEKLFNLIPQSVIFNYDFSNFSSSRSGREVGFMDPVVLALESTHVGKTLKDTYFLQTDTRRYRCLFSVGHVGICLSRIAATLWFSSRRTT